MFNKSIKVIIIEKIMVLKIGYNGIILRGCHTRMHIQYVLQPHNTPNYKF